MTDEPIIVRKAEKRLVRKLPRPANAELDPAEPHPMWFAAMTEPRREEDADRDLRRLRYWTFFPHLRQRVKMGRFVHREVIRPLFPNYLFVGLRRGMSLYAANEAIGVATIVHLGGLPLAIPDHVMTEIMARCDGDSDRIAPERKDKAELAFGGKPGDAVRLGAEAGPFQGLTRQILRIEHSRIILDWVDGELGVSLEHVAELIPAGGAS